MIVKFATQRETLEDLKDIKAQNEAKLMQLTDKKQQVKDYLEKMKLEGKEALDRKYEEDLERQLAKAEQEYSDAKDQHDHFQKMVLDLQAGVEHLCYKLNEVKLSKPSDTTVNIEKVTQSNIVEGIEQVRHKMKVVLKDLSEDP